MGWWGQGGSGVDTTGSHASPHPSCLHSAPPPARPCPYLNTPPSRPPCPHPAAKLRRHQAGLLRPANSGGGDADGSDYAAALGQKVALELGAAADDCAAVFGREGAAELCAAFLVWALHQTER